MGVLQAAFLVMSMTAASGDELDRLNVALRDGDLATVASYFENHDGNLTGDQMFLRGRLRMAQGQHKDAVEDFEEAAEALPQREEVWLHLADAAGQAASNAGAMSAAGMAKKAKRALEKVVELNPSNVDARGGLIQFHLQAPWIVGGRKKEARRQAEAIARIDPVQGKVWKARVALATGKADDAEALFRSILEAHPDQPDVAITLATLLHSKSKWAEANEVLRPYAEADPPNLGALYQVGRTGALSGQYLAGSAVAMRRYIELASNQGERPVPLSPAYWRLGMILQHQNQPEEARGAFEQALALDPDNEEAQKSLESLPPAVAK